MLTKIYLTKEMFDVYKVKDGNENELDNLSRVNIFVGANNSGKSRFLRGVFRESNLTFQDDRFDLVKINTIVKSALAELRSYTNEHKIRGYNRFQEELKKIAKEIKHLTWKMDFNSFFYNPLYDISNVEQLTTVSNRTNLHITVTNHVRELGQKYLDELIEIYPKDSLKIDKKRIYIPILRGLRNVAYSIEFNLHNEDVYWKRTKDDYFEEIEFETDRIFTGLNLYKDVKRKLLGKRPDREKIKAFENFLSETFFQGAEINIITPEKENQITHVYIDGVDWPIHHLGDGVQSIIALTYPMFFNQGEDMVFFIEEPEHCLHPGFQRIFMEVLMREEFKSFQYFITTHSNHLLDMTLDERQVSIYTFQKNSPDKKFQGKPTFTIENVDNAETDILDLLGVRTSSVFLTNCTIWVEGITDRLYIQQYLKVYQEHLADQNKVMLEKNPNGSKNLHPIFKEDLHFSYVEYGGNNITHWSFLEDEKTNNNTIDVKRLCAKLFLISDQDGAGLNKDGNEPKIPSAKTIRHQKLEENLKERYHCLPVREIENLLSPEVLQSVLKTYEGEKGVTIPLFRYDVYKNMKLGNFIQNKLTGTSRTYKEDSGTIKDKVNFARKAIQAIESFDDLSPDAKALVKKIYDFVKSQNEGQETISKS